MYLARRGVAYRHQAGADIEIKEAGETRSDAIE